MKIKTFVLSCPQRATTLNETLERFAKTDWPEAPTVVMDQGYDANPQISQAANTLSLLKISLTFDWQYILFLEDDLDFNVNLYHNLQLWTPLKYNFLLLGSLYNPGIDATSMFAENHYFVANCDKLYGSQALIINRAIIPYLIERWGEVAAMQDIRVGTLINQISRTYLISLPNLVDHIGTESTWGGQTHKAREFDKYISF